MVREDEAGDEVSQRGFFAIGMWHPKTETNVGSAWRAAASFGAAFMFTVGRRYRSQASDTMSATSHTPLFHFADIDDVKSHLPHGCQLIGVELDDRAVMLNRFRHPDRGVYLMGAEDHGLPPNVLDTCHHVVQIPYGRQCLNVANAAAIVIYDRARAREREKVAA